MGDAWRLHHASFGSFLKSFAINKAQVGQNLQTIFLEGLNGNNHVNLPLGVGVFSNVF